MSQIEYKKMSLFDAPEGSILVHAVNSQGVWGSGIAKEFKERYPIAYEYYKEHCEFTNFNACGKEMLCQAKNLKHKVGWLITSENYGNKKDSKELIKINTVLALNSFCNDFLFNETIYSNKFNSGLFAVPWEETELILKTVLKRYPNIKWVVCDPNLGD